MKKNEDGATDIVQALMAVFKGDAQRALKFFSENTKLTSEELLLKAGKEVGMVYAVSKQRKREPIEDYDPELQTKTWRDILFVLKEISRTAFPTERLKKGYVLRKTQVAPGVVAVIEFNAIHFESRGVPLPYGTLDRKVFDALTTLAFLHKSSVITMKSTRQFIQKWLGQNASGKKTYVNLAESIRRIRGCTITITLEGSKVELGEGEGLISRWYLPTRGESQPALFQDLPSAPDELHDETDDESFHTGTEFKIELNAKLFKTLLQPGQSAQIPMEYLAHFDDKPKDYDFAKWLAIRVGDARSTSAIPWREIWKQIGTDPNFSRWRTERMETLKFIKENLWSACNAVATQDKLVVGPVAEHERIGYWQQPTITQETE